MFFDVIYVDLPRNLLIEEPTDNDIIHVKKKISKYINRYGNETGGRCEFVPICHLFMASAWFFSPVYLKEFKVILFFTGGSASKSVSSNTSIIGILRENGKIDAFVQPENYGAFLSHEQLGLTKSDLGFTLFYTDGEWGVRGSGYAAGKNWAQPSLEQQIKIKKLFGVGD